MDMAVGTDMDKDADMDTVKPELSESLEARGGPYVWKIYNSKSVHKNLIIIFNYLNSTLIKNYHFCSLVNRESW